MEQVTGEWLSRDEVAQRLAVHRRTVSRLLDSGELVGYRVGGQWRVDRADLEEYLRRVRNVPSDAEGVTADDVRRLVSMLDDERIGWLLSQFGLTEVDQRDIQDAKTLFRQVLLEALDEKI